MKRSTLSAFTACAIAFAPAVFAGGTITAIAPGADQVTLKDGKATVRFMVSGQGDDSGDCGMHVNYGDGDSPDTRTIGRQGGSFPREFVHTFTRAGQFAVNARGERVKQTFGCSGDASTTVNIVEESRGRWRASAQSCPAGWSLKDRSFDRETGAFSCVADLPEQRIECGPGLRYFEAEGLVGCRTRGSSRR